MINHLRALRCDPFVLDCFPNLGWLSVSADRREALTEKQRREAKATPWVDCDRAHENTLVVSGEEAGRSSEFEVRNPDVETLEVFPITVAVSVLNARHGTRHAALIPRRRPPARNREE